MKSKESQAFSLELKDLSASDQASYSIPCYDLKYFLLLYVEQHEFAVSSCISSVSGDVQLFKSSLRIYLKEVRKAILCAQSLRKK